MRLWFVGWNREDFRSQPKKFLEVEQQHSYDAYGSLVRSCHDVLKPGAPLILHLGETANENMVEKIRPQLEGKFEVIHAGREDVGDTESHGLSDKGATRAHWYLFARSI